ncbi:hypothetical protein JOB18_012152, partial [Solea senegalensis]
GVESANIVAVNCKLSTSFPDRSVLTYACIFEIQGDSVSLLASRRCSGCHRAKAQAGSQHKLK